MKIPTSISALTCLLVLTYEGLAVTRYVDLNSATPAPPHDSWMTAATNIQDAIDAASPGDVILVTNGVYQTGGAAIGTLLLTNRIAVTKAITVQSVNGPQQTIIRGYQLPGTTNGNGAMRCAYLTNGASLIGFTLSEGATRVFGDNDTECSAGGLYCASTNAYASNCVITLNASGYAGSGVSSGTLTDCIICTNFALVGRAWGAGALNSVLNRCTIIGNIALQSGGGVYGCSLERCQVLYNRAGIGGGAYNGDARNSLFVGNVAPQQGGGVLETLLYNCTVVGNTSGTTGGGYYGNFGTIRNCIVYFNSAPSNPNVSGKYSYCCLLANSLTDPNSFTNAPLFVDAANGDFRLQSDSPCINAGANSYVIGSVDLDGNVRIVGGTVDVGPYEFQSPGSLISYAWLKKYGLPTDGSVDFVDGDSDGMHTWGEWRGDTIPTNTASVLTIGSVTNSPSGPKITWQSVSSRFYYIQRADSFGPGAFQTIATNILGAAGTKSYTDTSATGSGPYFYRVGVQPF